MAEQAGLFNAVTVVSIDAGGLTFVLEKESALETGSTVIFSGAIAGLTQRLTILTRPCG